MAERNDHETNVVPLQRRKDPAEADRASLARTIFADEDDIGTFSRGNLVPPSSKRSPQDENQDASMTTRMTARTIDRPSQK